MICAAAGALLAHFLGAFSPSKFYFDDTLALLTMLIVGGMTTVSGAFFGAVAVTLTVEILRRIESGIDIFGWQTPEMFGLTQAGLCLLILLVMYRAAGGPVRAAGARRGLAAPAVRRRRSRTPAATMRRRRRRASSTPKACDQGFRRPARARRRRASTCGRGRSSGLIGPNGSGKTTLLNIISGLFAPSAGRILIDGARCDAVAGARGRARRHRPHLPEHPPVRPAERARECRDRRPRRAGWPGRLRPRAPSRCSCWREFGLADLADRPAATLDYGAQRRLEIARALALRPRYLLLDEPARRHESRPNRTQLLRRSRASCARRTGIGLLVIDHDMSLIMRLCDRIVVLNRGQVIAEGNAAEIQTQSGRHRGLYRPQACQARVPTATSPSDARSNVMNRLAFGVVARRLASCLAAKPRRPTKIW